MNLIDQIYACGCDGWPDPQTNKLAEVKLYAEMDLPPCAGLPAVRKTKARLEQLGAHDFVGGESVLEVGSHIGAMSFRLKELGAKEIFGVETNAMRLNVAKEIAHRNKVKDVTFADVWPRRKFDVVFAMSVDAYVLDLWSFYDQCMRHAKKIMVLESNIQVYDTHPFVKFCDEHGLDYKWLGEPVDKYPYSANRTRNLFLAVR